RIGILGAVLRKDLDRHFSSESRVPRPVDLSHSSGAEGRHDLVGTQSRPGGNGHGEPGEILTSAGQSRKVMTSWSEADAFDEIEKAAVVAKGREPGVYVEVNEPARALVEGPLQEVESLAGLAEAEMDDGEVVGGNETAPR